MREVVRPIDTPEHVLAGGGAMGALMRARDWSRTPVGPVRQWPQSLRTALSILLDSHYPMYIAWGREFVQFYNDAYRPILGSTKHPAALGQGTRECFAEIWDFIGPMFDRVLARGEATYLEDQLLPLDRHGYVEECYFTFCYSAIRHESGDAGGVFVTVIETTARVLGERRLRTLRDLGAAALEAKTADSACTSAVDILGADPKDVPFLLLYLFDETRQEARLVGLAGLDAAHPAAPPSIDLTAAGRRSCWPFEAMAAHVAAPLVVDLEGLVGEECGPWPEHPRQALVLPIAQPGQDRPAGVLIAGISGRRRLDGEYRDFLQLAAGHVATAVSNARAYEAERRRAEALAELDRAKTAFFSNVSHEFRTPLTLMLAPLEDLLESADRPAPEQASLQVVQRNALRLLRLVNTLLDFSRIEAGRVDACYEPCDLAALTADLASAFRSAVERAGLRLDVATPPLPEPVYVDRDMWEKIVLNLLSNAFKHTFEGSIGIALHDRGDRIELVVSDTGVGIPQEDLPHVFDRFHRVQRARARTHEGTGIGLALVHELVRQHGGTIAVQSEIGVGTSFAVAIPFGKAHLPADRIGRARTAPSTAIGATPFVEEALRWLPEHVVHPTPLPASAVDSAVPAAERRAGAQRARLLVVDDNADMREYLARLLGGSWAVEVAADGVRALEAIRERRPDLVLADVMMPGIDGFELVRTLRADARTADTPVVLVSARAGEESRVEALEAGADDLVVKPFSARELVARVHSTLELARLRREAARERERLIGALTIEREQLVQIFERAPAFIAVLRGADHVFERINPRYQEIVGPRPILGRPIRVALPELEGQGYFELLDQVYRTGEPFVGNENVVRLEREKGAPLEEVYVNFVYQPLRDEAGEINGLFVHGVDITDLVVARKAAEAADRAKGDFVAMISHELRTPLNAILGYAELLMVGVPEAIPPQSRQHVERVTASARHLLQLIDELLTFTRLEAEREVADAESVELRPLLDEIRAILEPLATKKALDFRVHVSDAPAVIRTDPRKLRQIVLNLLGNAVKFTTEGCVELEIGPEAGALRFTVRDSGPGIARADMDRIFEPFWQADQTRTRRHGGTGLGLAISKRLADMLGGHIAVESEPGAGTTFTLALPMEDSGRDGGG